MIFLILHMPYNKRKKKKTFANDSSIDEIMIVGVFFFSFINNGCEGITFFSFKSLLALDERPVEDCG